jgi:hypothetical protein
MLLNLDLAFASFVLELVVYLAIYEISRCHFEMKRAPAARRSPRCHSAVARGGALTAFRRDFLLVALLAPAPKVNPGAYRSLVRA